MPVFRTHFPPLMPDYHDIFMPSRLLMGALTVPMNSQGGPIMDRRDGRDFAVSIEREHPDVRSSRATLEQRLLKNGDRLLTLGEIEGAIGARVGRKESSIDTRTALCGR